MRRRVFLAAMGGGVIASSTNAHGQQSALPMIGWLDNTSAAGAAARIASVRQGLGELGLVEGRNLAPIEFRFADGRADRLPALAVELVRLRVAVIISNNTGTPFAKSATSTIPIVFASGADPVEVGLVDSLNHPGGNVTGVSFFTAPVGPKRLELFHLLAPNSAVIAVLVDANQAEGVVRDTLAAARALGRQALLLRANTEADIDAAFATMVQAGVGALFVGTGALFNSRRRQIVALAARHALPASYHLREFVVAGGLMSYGASDTDAYRRAARYVGRILKGERPGDLPVELPTRYELVFNLATAKALKLEIPAKLLALADEVIE
jgi:putative ABC transport system substrate-binding protein